MGEILTPAEKLERSIKSLEAERDQLRSLMYDLVNRNPFGPKGRCVHCGDYAGHKHQCPWITARIYLEGVRYSRQARRL